MNNEKKICKSKCQAPKTIRLQIETEGGFAGSLNDTPSGTTTTQDWSYINNTGDCDTCN